MLSGEILWVAVVHHKEIVPGYVVHCDQVTDGFLKCPERLIVFEVPDMLANECLPIYDERNRIFQIGADGQDGSIDGQTSDCFRSVSTCATQDRWPVRAHAYY